MMVERSGRGKRRVVYLDSGPLVALALGADDMHYGGAVRACEAAVRSGCRLVTSLLAIMEMVNVLRRRMAASCKCRPGRGEDQEAADARVRRAVERALVLVMNMKRSGALEIMETAGWSPDLDFLLGKMLEHPGRIVSGMRSRTCRHRGVGPYDWFHYALALLAGASVICTTDAALADVAGSDAQFGRIQVQLTGGPLIGPLSGRAA